MKTTGRFVRFINNDKARQQNTYYDDTDHSVWVITQNWYKISYIRNVKIRLRVWHETKVKKVNLFEEHITVLLIEYLKKYQRTNKQYYARKFKHNVKHSIFNKEINAHV